MSKYSHPQRLPPVPEGKGAKFHKSWFERVIARIENIKPVGEGQADYGSEASGPIECRIKSEDGVEIIFKGQEYTVNVCNNGEISQIKLYGPKNQET
jgi:hypothetical protein